MLIFVPFFGIFSVTLTIKPPRVSYNSLTGSFKLYFFDLNNPPLNVQKIHIHFH